LSVLSSLPDSAVMPSGENATDLTASVCPAKVRINLTSMMRVRAASAYLLSGQSLRKSSSAATVPIALAESHGSV
jgi:hypothetical protein